VGYLFSSIHFSISPSIINSHENRNFLCVLCEFSANDRQLCAIKCINHRGHREGAEVTEFYEKKIGGRFQPEVYEPHLTNCPLSLARISMVEIVFECCRIIPLKFKTDINYFANINFLVSENSPACNL